MHHGVQRRQVPLAPVLLMSSLFVVLLSSAASCLVSCRAISMRAPNEGPAVGSLAEVQIENAVWLAVHTARARGALGSREFEVRARSGTNHKWVVWIIFLPYTPDAELMVFVDADGTVRGPWDPI